MMNLPLGMILLLVVSVLIYFGLAQRILDRMRMTDKQALLFIAGIIVGSFIDIPLMRTPVDVSINVGGALLPALLCFWLIYKADETAERVRAVLAAVLVAAAVFLGSRYLPYEPENMFLDPKLIYGLAAGIIAYIAGRSRRSAFIGGVLGIILSDIVHMVTLTGLGIPGTTAIGGAGAFDVVIIAGTVAVMIAELVGETREKLQGGPVLGPNRPEGLYEFSKEIQPTSKKDNEKNADGNASENTSESTSGSRGEKSE
ncbi:MAG TPA: DUF1614 domain-containing protein [Methylomusa anaerophila]|uniref:DUF1614 domain-containing protein n=1 Tax=Methylomusa anaerophila TaxID=1930071 RepID=A0A348APH7_9FIRM|nr:DUF1614 domain-containing protein [Methylomusa anaerophila]BBB92975.1 hypothetical protein MAMMFC1_03683 [Methylomusa anaerophila]HML87191.1 DUF1614 domain-containing protein [Methylomusa anaerophila]